MPSLSLCDCWNHNDAAIVPDLGILASADPVALDKACADMVIQAPILHGNNCLATAHEHDDLCGCDKFHLMHPDTDWLAGLRHAEKIGLGTMEYELVKMGKPHFHISFIMNVSPEFD